MTQKFKTGQKVRLTSMCSQTGRVVVWNMGSNADAKTRANWVPVRFEDGNRMLIERDRLEAVA